LPGAEPRIVAFGGASLLPGSTDGPLHQFLLDLTGEGYPRVCFLGTASGDDYLGPLFGDPGHFSKIGTGYSDVV